jgi:hypothetical protein
MKKHELERYLCNIQRCLVSLPFSILSIYMERFTFFILSIFMERYILICERGLITCNMKSVFYDNYRREWKIFIIFAEEL